MYTGQFVFSRLIAHLPKHTCRRCVTRYRGERYVKRFSRFDRYLAMAFAQLAHQESLRDIEACLQAHQNKLYHMGMRSPFVARNALAKANERRDWRIYADFAQAPIRIAISVYVLVAITRKRLGIDAEPYTTLQILNLTLFEKMPLHQLLN
jgi:hypothetical protein